MAKKSGDDKVPVGFRMDGSLLDWAKAFVASQTPPPTLTGVMETALREFLERRAPKVKPKK